MKSERSIRILQLFVGCFLFGVLALHIQQVQAAENAGAELPAADVTKNVSEPRAVTAPDELGRNTPRDAIVGFLAAAKDGKYDRAAQYLDLKFRRQRQIATEGPQLAKKLYLIMEHKLLFDPLAINDSVEGKIDDGLPAIQERIGRVNTPGKTFDLMLEKISDGGPVPVWKISRATVNDIPDMTRRVVFGSAGKFLPVSFFRYFFFGITCAEWLFFFIVTLMSMSVSWLIFRMLILIVKKSKNEYLSALIDHIRWPLWALLSVILGRAVFLRISTFSMMAQTVMKAKTGVFLFGVWLILRLVDFFTFEIGLMFKQRGTPESTNLIKFIGKIIKTCVVLAGLTWWLENIGVKISALLAGIGIGGIAFALASQKSIEDLFGAFTIIGYRPVKLGEWIRFGENMGNVVEIGVRYTRIRTMERTMLNIPNGQLSSMPIENLSRRDKFRYLTVIDLGYETTPDQLRYILMELRTMLYSDARVSSDPSCWARFKEFGAYSLKVEVSAWVRTNDPMKYREIAEDLNLKIMELVLAAGASFAYPTQVEYHQDSAPIKTELVKKAEDQVKKWKAEGKLFIDAFPPEEIARLRQTNKK
jgi:MscS family membrane protein